jgi:hypothetical protein
MRLAIVYAFIALIFEGIISSWVRAWWPGADTRIPFYFVMPVLFGTTLAILDRWITRTAFVAIFLGALAGYVSSVVASEVVRFSVIGIDRYVHGWVVFGWYSSVSTVLLGSVILGGWFIGALSAVARYLQSRRNLLTLNPNGTHP